VFFLSETHFGKIKAEKLKRRLGCDHFIIDESDGRSGGLLMLWRKELNIQCLGVSNFFIDVEIRGDEVWRLTGIYGEPKWDQKHLTWEALRALYGGGVLMPWLAIGDFNEILYHHEKEGGRRRAQVHLQAFQDALMDCELADIGFSRVEFTWQRGRIRERLDRGTANAGWNTLFPNAQLINGEMVKSDHRPLIVNTEGCSSFVKGPCLVLVIE